MKCSNCGQEVADGSSFCNNCGTPINITGASINEQPANKSVNNKKSNKGLIIIVTVIILISAIVVGGVILINNSNENTPSVPENNKTSNLEGKVDLAEDNGSHKIYNLSIDENGWVGKYDFKVGNHIITMELEKNENEIDIAKMYVDNTYIFDDFYIEYERENLYNDGISIDTLGDYIILYNHDGTDIKSHFMYIIDKDGKSFHKVYELDKNGIVMYDWTINETGITLYGNISSGIQGYVDLPTASEINICNKSEWPEGFDENYIYSTVSKLEYTNGTLDFNGKVLESQTVSEILSEFQQYDYCSVE